MGCGGWLVCIERMSGVLSFTPESGEKQPEQLSLPGAQEMFEAVGLNTLPLGAGDLSRKQLEFCINYLKTGSAKAAAEMAGYADPEAHGSKILKTPAVARFLAKSVAKVSANAEQLISRVWTRSANLQAQIEKLQQSKTGDWKKEKELTHYANQTDALLASLLGKLQLNVNHSTSDTLKPEVRAEIIKIQEAAGWKATG